MLVLDGGGAEPMQVDPATWEVKGKNKGKDKDGKGKNKGKDKGKQKGKRKDDKGNKGKQVLSEQLQGYCGHCNKRGHTRAVCRQRLREAG